MKEKYIMKRVSAVAFSALLLCSLNGCSTIFNHSGHNNTVNHDSSVNHDIAANCDENADQDNMSGLEDASGQGAFSEIDAAALPSKVDLRNYNGKNYVTPVKSQGYGDCWAFSLSGCAEIAYLFANDLGVPAGENNENVNFSEKYIAWYMFHGITKEDVVPGKVRASQIGEGFDLSEAEKTNELAAYYIGGAFVQSANLFGAGFGPVDESVTVNGEKPYVYGDQTGNWQLPLTAEYRSIPANAFFRESSFLPSPAMTDETGEYLFNEKGIIAIKSELSKGHGVSVAINALHAGINYENQAVYYNGPVQPNHAVTVVGYDDDYPKENFTRRKKKSGEVIEGSTPPKNGALIIKNSWGTTDSDAGNVDDGYIYLSYYDHSLCSPFSFAFDNNGLVKYTAPEYDQYDLMMTKWYGSADHDTETKMANVFDAEQDECLYQIEYTTIAPKTEVTYEIYKDVEMDRPSSGELLETGVCRHVYGGAHVIDLKKEYALQKGEKYAVVLTMSRLNEEDGKMLYTDVFPYSTTFFDGLAVKGIINAGESYLYTDGKWSDMYTMKDKLIEMAFAQCAAELASDQILPSLALNSKEKFTVDNFPIKVILVPVDKQ